MLVFAGSMCDASTDGLPQSSASPGIGALVGTGVGALLLGVVITTFILLGIPRSVLFYKKYKC